ncbi:response regulator transcription factor [Nannocystis bainbridge]|uniref:Response regulator transcription factor n=1 Tax=Nannocystis bainbridge TaxID=2995303 RepID=A0ABT5DRN9_9BACT|nr:response regulator transcription factor [Nannocystis bainbridge]MDC0716211.1 response regulator transcription factor [Nannocystis bainbridge]
MHVLIVDDDEETLELVASTLRREGHRSTPATGPEEALRAVAAGEFDVIVLDVMLGQASGLELCAELRRREVQAPILFLSARGTVGARVDGLDAGGDDYLPKPFAVRELLARIRALGRRGPSLRPSVLRAGEVLLDFTARKAFVAGREVPVTAREWDVLRVLADARGRVVSFDDILERSWGEVSEKTRASLEVIMSRLRRKLDAGSERGLVRTVRGFGYALELEP